MSRTLTVTACSALHPRRQNASALSTFLATANAVCMELNILEPEEAVQM
jgi:hypothetical protein